MPNIKLRAESQAVTLDVDIRLELEQFEWTRPTWSADKLIAASPMRYDKSPSFYVHLDGENAGLWGDSGHYDEDWAKGGFVKLLAFLRDETYEETANYLIATYGASDGESEYRLPTLELPKERRRITLDEALLADYRYRSPYLANRGINERTQRFLGVGYSHKHRAITLPWRHTDGTLANVKYRQTRGKVFYYERGAEPIRRLVYGLHAVYSHSLREVYVCEAEIDAMSIYSVGRPAIAIGGASVSQTQLDAIKKSPIERVVIATDNDKAGVKLRAQLTEGLRGYVDLAELRLPDGFKDANEALVGGVLDVENTRSWRNLADYAGSRFREVETGSGRCRP